MIMLMAMVVNIATFLVYNGYGVLLPPMRDSLGLSHFQEGVLITVYSGLNMVTNVLSGVLAPRYGTRYIAGFSAISAGVAMVILGQSNTVAFALMMTAVMGLFIGGVGTPTMGLLMVWFDGRSRGKAAGLAAAGSGFSFIIMGFMVPWLTETDPENGWRHTWYVLGAVHMVVGLVCLGLLRENPAAAPVRKITWPIAAFKNRAVLAINALSFCSGWCQGLYVSFFGEYLKAEGISLVVVGWLWGLTGLVSIAGGILWGGLSDRIGRPRAFLLSYLVYGVGLLLFWLAPFMVGFVISVILVAVVFRANYTLTAAASADYVPPHMVAAVFGIAGIGVGMGRAMSPPLAGRIADVTGDLGWAFALGAVGAFLGVFLAQLLPRTRQTT